MWLRARQPQAAGAKVPPSPAPRTRPSIPAMTTSTIREHLREMRFLTGLTDTAIHQLAKLVTQVSYAGDQLIFEEGAPREVAVIIHTGAVAIEKNVNGRPVRLATLGPGDSVGEGLLLDETPHGTTARTLSPTDASCSPGSACRKW
jgi:CRP-like cAMP-binding protein